jgi:hypothetical protein
VIAMTDDAFKCADCEGNMVQVKLIDKAHGVNGRTQTSMEEYALIDSKISFWRGTRAIAGTVNAYMCDSCGVLKLYGVPKVE